MTDYDQVPMDIPDQAAQTLHAGGAMQQVRTQYTTAVMVQKPRQNSVVENRIIAEAKIAGSAFFYGWGAGKNRIEGPSVECAMAAVRCFGNCAIDMQPVQDLGDSWVMTAVFVDLETGMNVSRQFRQSKNWEVHGKHNEERKDDMRFQIGQSKAIRNVVLNCVPKWLIRKAMDAAKSGVHEKIVKQIERDGHGAVAQKAVSILKDSFRVSKDRVLEKFGRAAIEALSVEDLVIIEGDIDAMRNSLDTSDTLYPRPQAGSAESIHVDPDVEESLTNPVVSNGELESAQSDAASGDDAPLEGAQSTESVEDPTDGDDDDPNAVYVQLLEFISGAVTEEEFTEANNAIGTAYANGGLDDGQRAMLQAALRRRLDELGG